MSEALCLEDSYLRECNALVEAVNGKEIILDHTIFYPRGGGQPSDTGKLISENGRDFSIVLVSKKNGKTVHELETLTDLKPGDKVKCILNWERRYKLMRMHTAAHVLAATMHKDLNILITGNQLEEDKTRFDFNMEDFNRESFAKVVEKTNELLKQNCLLKIYSLPREEAMKIPGVVKLANALPPSIKILRIVEIPEIDIQADGGTHVKNLQEVGQIEILKLENKGKNNRRIYFTLM
ncbi:alanyl-tRNA editing protein [Candidatus Micrarchaeota archaeon]|nr:alanyl-tRNA editing protein [Candidatus Micrarchaeota archaeon]